MMLDITGRKLGTAGLVAALLVLAACGGVRNPLSALRSSIPPPDEFQVVVHEPLQMPASATLPEPTPGMPSPRDPNPQADAVAALLGTSAVASAAGPSAGESVLLSSANVAAASGDIRVQLDQEKADADKNKPYQPPSLAEVLGLASKKPKVDEAEILDPVTEAQRLQQGGVLTPFDPDAEPTATSDEVPPLYPLIRVTRDQKQKGAIAASQ